MNGAENQHITEREDLLEELFRHASARERPPPDDEAAIREALHAEWRVITGRRRRRRTALSLAAAASLVLAVLIGTNMQRGPQVTTPAEQLASIQKVTGNAGVRSSGNGTAWEPGPGDILQSGQTVVTGSSSRLAVGWRDGTALRVDQNSEIKFLVNGELELVSGRVYVDTETVGGFFPGLAIITPAGRVRHLGTQYMTAVREKRTTVSVRQGKVELSIGVDTVLTGRGEQLTVNEAGSLHRESIPTYGAPWEWMEALTPPFASNGRTLAEFLLWVSRHSGRTIAYATPEAEALAGDTVLRGEVDMEPMRALDALLQTSDLSAKVQDGAIVISLPSGD